MELSNLRHDFGKYAMDEKNLIVNPVDQFKTWIKHAADQNILDFNAMVLSTVNFNGKPSSRVVLLKEINDIGELVFFTNYNSKKGRESKENPFVALNFFWKELERQVRIEGNISKTSREVSKQYFDSRPFESRIGAVVSPQSQVIDDIDILRKKAKEFSIEREIEIPKNWGGYIVTPNYYEFWQGGKNRMHDRISYRLEKSKWERVQLAP